MGPARSRRQSPPRASGSTLTSGDHDPRRRNWTPFSGECLGANASRKSPRDGIDPAVPKSPEPGLWVQRCLHPPSNSNRSWVSRRPNALNIRDDSPMKALAGQAQTCFAGHRSRTPNSIAQTTMIFRGTPVPLANGRRTLRRLSILNVGQRMASKGAIVAIALVMVLSGLIVPTISSRAPAPAGDHVLTSHVPLTAGNAPAPAQPDQGWQTPIALESQTASNANLAGIALSAAGPGMVVWQLGGQRNVLMATHFVPNGGGDGGSDWQVPVKISNSYNDIGIAYHGAVAMDAAGDAMAVYYTWNDTHGYTVFATLYQAGVGWKTPVAIDQPFDWSYYPVVAMNAVGDAFVMWQVWNGAWYSMWANRYVHGIGWATAQQIEPTSNITWGQDIAIDGSGNAIA